MSNFNYYILSMTYTPFFCTQEGAAKPLQCSDIKSKSILVLHGLWPQKEDAGNVNCSNNETHTVTKLQKKRIPCFESKSFNMTIPRECGGETTTDCRNNGCGNTNDEGCLDPSSITDEHGNTIFPTVDYDKVKWDADLTDDQKWWAKNAPGYKGTNMDPNLVYHEWCKHGECSGLEPNDYFSFARKLFEMTMPFDEIKEKAGTFLTSTIIKNIIGANLKNNCKKNNLYNKNDVNFDYSSAVSVLCKGNSLREIHVSWAKNEKGEPIYPITASPLERICPPVPLWLAWPYEDSSKNIKGIYNGDVRGKPVDIYNPSHPSPHPPPHPPPHPSRPLTPQDYINSILGAYDFKNKLLKFLGYCILGISIFVGLNLLFGGGVPINSKVVIVLLSVLVISILVGFIVTFINKSSKSKKPHPHPHPHPHPDPQTKDDCYDSSGKDICTSIEAYIPKYSTPIPFSPSPRYSYEESKILITTDNGLVIPSSTKDLFTNYFLLLYPAVRTEVWKEADIKFLRWFYNKLMWYYTPLIEHPRYPYRPDHDLMNNIQRPQDRQRGLVSSYHNSVVLSSLMDVNEPVSGGCLGFKKVDGRKANSVLTYNVNNNLKYCGCAPGYGQKNPEDWSYEKCKDNNEAVGGVEGSDRCAAFIGGAGSGGWPTNASLRQPATWSDKDDFGNPEKSRGTMVGKPLMSVSFMEVFGGEREGVPSFCYFEGIDGPFEVGGNAQRTAGITGKDCRAGCEGGEGVKGGHCGPLGDKNLSSFDNIIYHADSENSETICNIMDSGVPLTNTDITGDISNTAYGPYKEPLYSCVEGVCFLDNKNGTLTQQQCSEQCKSKCQLLSERVNGEMNNKSDSDKKQIHDKYDCKLDNNKPVNQSNCEEKGCCWFENSFNNTSGNDVPFCLNIKENFTDTDDPCNINTDERKDCIGPDGGDENVCKQNVNCCYEKTDDWNVPYCYKKLSSPPPSPPPPPPPKPSDNWVDNNYKNPGDIDISNLQPNTIYNDCSKITDLIMYYQVMGYGKFTPMGRVGLFFNYGHTVLTAHDRNVGNLEGDTRWTIKDFFLRTGSKSSATSFGGSSYNGTTVGQVNWLLKKVDGRKYLTSYCSQLSDLLLTKFNVEVPKNSYIGRDSTGKILGGRVVKEGIKPRTFEQGTAEIEWNGKTQKEWKNPDGKNPDGKNVDKAGAGQFRWQKGVNYKYKNGSIPGYAQYYDDASFKNNDGVPYKDSVGNLMCETQFINPMDDDFLFFLGKYFVQYYYNPSDAVKNPYHGKNNLDLFKFSSIDDNNFKNELKNAYEASKLKEWPSDNKYGGNQVRCDGSNGKCWFYEKFGGKDLSDDNISEFLAVMWVASFYIHGDPGQTFQGNENSPNRRYPYGGFSNWSGAPSGAVSQITKAYGWKAYIGTCFFPFSGESNVCLAPKHDLEVQLFTYNKSPLGPPKYYPTVSGEMSQNSCYECKDLRCVDISQDFMFYCNFKCMPGFPDYRGIDTESTNNNNKYLNASRYTRQIMPLESTTTDIPAQMARSLYQPSLELNKTPATNFQYMCPGLFRSDRKCGFEVSPSDPRPGAIEVDLDEYKGKSWLETTDAIYSKYPNAAPFPFINPAEGELYGESQWGTDSNPEKCTQNFNNMLSGWSLRNNSNAEVNPVNKSSTYLKFQ